MARNRVDLNVIMRAVLRVWILMVLFGCFQAGVHAQLTFAGPDSTGYTVRLGWSPSPSPEVTGYNVYYGYYSGQYSGRLEAGNVTDVRVAGLTTNVVYYFMVAAHDDFGLESIPSNEVSYSVPLAEVQAPAITSGPMDQSVVVGETTSFSVTATGTSPLSYQWLFNGAPITGATTSSYTLNNVQVANAGNYAVQVTNTAASVVSSSAALTVLQPPMIATQPVSQSVALGSNVTFSVTATGTAPLAYQWLFNGAPITGATTSSYTLNNVQVANAGNYAVQVTNVVGSVFSAGAVLGIIEAPVIVSQPEPQYVTLGSSATFNVMAAGSDPMTYQWFLNSTRVAGANSSSYTRSNVKSQYLGNYSVLVSNAIGAVKSVSVPLALVQAPAITTQPVSQSVALGSDTTFTVVATGGPLNYQWLFNGSTLAGATNSEYTRAGVTQQDSGDYWVIITNAAGAATSAKATLALAEVSVAGTVSYYPSDYPAGSGAGLGVGGVSLVADSRIRNSQESTVTASDGSFGFGPMVAGDYVSIAPRKTSDTADLRALTALDLAYVQQHLLSPTLLESPYRLLAADVDGSESVTSQDLALMRQRLLGQIGEFPSGTWRFVTAAHVFPNPGEPWSAPATAVYESLLASNTVADFFAIKLGDANNSWGADEAQREGDGPGQPVVFRFNEINATPGSMVHAEVVVGGFALVTSAQFTLSWNPAILRYVESDSFGLRGLTAENFGVLSSDSGSLKFVWHDPEATGVTLPDGSSIFSVGFVVIGTNGAASPLAFVDSELTREVSAGLQEAAFVGLSGEVKVAAPPTQFQVLGSSMDAGVFRLWVPTEPGRTYVLEYTATLSGGNWVSLNSVTGDGGVKVLEDANATNLFRYYRVRSDAM